jgi:hypothetical protein
MSNNKTLIVILGETRAYELTFNNFKKNVLDELNADLCLCIGVKNDYNYDNPFYKNAMYKFIYNEPEEYSEYLDRATKIINVNKNNNNSWRDYPLKNSNLFGGIKYNNEKLKGSGAIQLFVRWFLLQSLNEHNLINKYDRFVITRSDFIYTLPHPSLEILDKEKIWIPNGEFYGGYTDRHVILSNTNINSYLNIFNNLIVNKNIFLDKINNSIPHLRNI